MQGMGITFGAINTVKGWIILRIVGSWAELIAILRSRSNFKIFQIKLRTVSKLKSHFCRSIIPHLGRAFQFHVKAGRVDLFPPPLLSCVFNNRINFEAVKRNYDSTAWQSSWTNGQKGGRNRRVQERRLTGLFEIVLTGSDSGVWSSTYMLFVYPYNIVSRSEIQGASRTLNWIQASATAE